jgi:signal transduction histidine kinase
MRLFGALVVLILVQTATFAQTVSPSRSGEAASIKAIDSLNKLSFDIYLESPDSARGIAEKALILSEQVKYHAGIGASFYNIGHVYWSQSYYPIALIYLNKALIDIPRNNNKLLASCYTMIGRTYSDLRNYKAAMENFEKAMKYAKDDPVRVADVYSERSLVYQRQGNYKLAASEAIRALALNRKGEDASNTAILYSRLATVYRITGRFRDALAYSDTAYAKSFSSRNRRLRAGTNIEYASIYNDQKSYDKAIFYAKRGLALADSLGVVDMISESYQDLIRSYEGKGDVHTAMQYQKQFARMQDSLNNFNKRRNTELIQQYFALDKKLNDMAEIERSNQQNKELVKSQQVTILTLAISLLIVMTLLGVTYYFYKQTKNFSQQLNDQNEWLLKQKQLIEAQKANLEVVSGVKDKLLAVIAHDLRTPLANLRGVTDMFDMDYLSNDEVRTLMKEINPIVKGAEMTLSNLLEWAGSNIKGRNVTTSRLDIFLLGVEMEQIFSHSLQKKSIEFVNQANPGQSVLADENHVKVVLRNLISNAIKFTNTDGHIVLRSELKDDKVVICVEDNGKGMTEQEIDKLFTFQTHFSKRGTQGESGTGIGLMLCKELIELNGGKVWVESKPNKGSKFYFSLPLNAEYA